MVEFLWKKLIWERAGKDNNVYYGHNDSYKGLVNIRYCKNTWRVIGITGDLYYSCKCIREAKRIAEVCYWLEIAERKMLFSRINGMDKDESDRWLKIRSASKGLLTAKTFREVIKEMDCFVYDEIFSEEKYPELALKIINDEEYSDGRERYELLLSKEELRAVINTIAYDCRVDMDYREYTSVIKLI